MKERPILFSGPMVRAILEGRKSQTRRVVKGEALEYVDALRFDPHYLPRSEKRLSRYGQPGDRLWVRETWAPACADHCCAKYKASEELLDAGTRWKPSIHMPRWASRITLEITGVRVERLQEISEEDAKNEGTLDWAMENLALGECPRSDRGVFAYLWDAINFDRAPWSSNPWVWVVEFRRISANPT